MTEPHEQIACAACGGDARPTAPDAITIVVGRRESLDFDDEDRVFHETQELSFCSLPHANEYLASNPIRDDAWRDSRIDTSEVGPLGSVLLGGLGLFLLTAVGVGIVTIGRWVLGIF